jgi:hypothetical protein
MKNLPEQSDSLPAQTETGFLQIQKRSANHYSETFSQKMLVPILIADPDAVSRHLEVVASASIMCISGNKEMLLNK